MAITVYNIRELIITSDNKWADRIEEITYNDDHRETIQFNWKRDYNLIKKEIKIKLKNRLDYLWVYMIIKQ